MITATTINIFAIAVVCLCIVLDDRCWSFGFSKSIFVVFDEERHLFVVVCFGRSLGMIGSVLTSLHEFVHGVAKVLVMGVCCLVQIPHIFSLIMFLARNRRKIISSMTSNIEIIIRFRSVYRVVIM